MFKVKTTIPEKGNKYYNTKSKGGYSTCIEGKCGSTGKPYDGLNVLANCVGWSCGRYNQIYSEITGYEGMKYPNFNCNAEKFIEYTVNKYYPELQVVDYPVIGGILVLDGGNIGHVIIIEQILERDDKGKPITILTSESGWNGNAFRSLIRHYDNGHWEMASKFKTLGCIVNPAVGIIEPTKTVERDKKKDQLQVLTDLYIRAEAGTDYPAIGMSVKNGIYNYYETKQVGDYIWYKIADNNWVAQDKNCTYLKIYEKQDKQVEELQNRVNELEKENQELKNEMTLLEQQLDEIIHNVTTFKDTYDITKDSTYSVHITAGEKIVVYANKEHEYKISLYDGDVLKIK